MFMSTRWQPQKGRETEASTPPASLIFQIERKTHLHKDFANVCEHWQWPIPVCCCLPVRGAKLGPSLRNTQRDACR